MNNKKTNKSNRQEEKFWNQIEKEASKYEVTVDYYLDEFIVDNQYFMKD